MTAKHKCSCDLTYFDHAPDCEARTRGNADQAALNVNAEVLALAAEAKTYSWGDLEELTALRADQQRLHDWLIAHTKVDPDVNAVDSAINILDTCRLAAEHLTPAIQQIIISAVSALRSAGIEIKGE